MKFFLQILLFFLLITQIHYPQWTNQNPVPDGNTLWSVFFINNTTGWIVGSEGFIKKTTNEGVDWVQQNSGTTLILKSVQFINLNTGWICGEGGLIIKTTDGGLNWFSLTSGTTEHLTDIYFYDLDTGYVVGFSGTILKTTNGGSVWTSLSSGTTNDLYSIDFIDAFVGYAVGGYSTAAPTMIKTTDGGITWIDKSKYENGDRVPMLTVEFIDANTGFAGDWYDVRLYKTTDGGDTWLLLPYIWSKKKEKNNIEQLYVYHVGYLNSIYFKDANNGWITRMEQVFDNCIFRTTDGGTTWEKKYLAFEEAPFLSVFITQDGTGWAVGASGLICLKEDNSSNWSLLFSGHRDEIYSIHFADENIGWAAAHRVEFNSPMAAIVLKTTNGGKIWKSQLVRYGNAMVCVYFINELIGWAVAGETLGIHLTTDGGNTWTYTYENDTDNNQFYPFYSLFFINENIGWLTESYSSGGSIRKSTDGGNNWIIKSSMSSLSIFFIDQNNGWVVGENGILKSTDGGETWVTKSSLIASYVRFYDSNVGMCVGGGTVLVSTDGGETWAAKSGPLLHSINFINSTTIWGYTSEGTVYKTTDFGDTWYPLNVGLGYGQTSFFINKNIGWVGGENYIFKYSVEPPPPPVWSNQILIEDAGGAESSQSLTFGQHIDATDSIDASLGEYELPPPPVPGIFDSRFNLPTNPQVSSFKDFRDSTQTEITWTMIFQTGSAGYPMTFSWDSTSFPEGTFYLKDSMNGSYAFVNMKNQGSFVLTEPAITSLDISYRGSCSIVSVNNYWNMISVPVLAEDMSVSNLFPTATSSAYGFDGSYVTEDTLVGGVGYWLKFGGDEGIQICGTTMGDTVQVETGWNMFGVYVEDILVSQITTTPPGIIATYFFGFDDGYYIADTLKSGKGYWVRVTEDGVINLNGGALSKDGEQEQLAKIDQNWGKIKITDNSGKSITLFATEEEIGTNFNELPPMPPTGIFDTRYSSGKLVEDLSSEQIIQISSDNYPITIRAEGISITVRDRINGELLNEELKDGEEIRIMNNKITSIEVTGRITGGLPISYELYQNYPNPFNPSTTIKFAVPKESNVNLSIYNVLGELVTTVVNQEMKPGYYEYEFNASNLASGVYLYRIKAGDPSASSGQGFVETKKMLMIK